MTPTAKAPYAMVPAARAPAAPRGLTLVECLVGSVVSAVVLAAALTLVVSGQRTAIGLVRSLEMHQNGDAIVSVLRSELAGSAAIELVSLSDSSVGLRAVRGAGAVCAVDPAGTAVLLDDAVLSAFRSIDPTRDSLRLVADGDPDRASDDTWLQFGIASVAGARCPSGTAATRLSLAGGGAALSGVGVGAPARLVELVEYRSYRDASGDRWFGTRSPSGSGWSATSPVAGPLAHPGGLVLRFLAADGANVSAADSVRLVQARVVVRSPGAVRRTSDTLDAVVAVAGPDP